MNKRKIVLLIGLTIFLVGCNKTTSKQNSVPQSQKEVIEIKEENKEKDKTSKNDHELEDTTVNEDQNENKIETKNEEISNDYDDNSTSQVIENIQKSNTLIQEPQISNTPTVSNTPESPIQEPSNEVEQVQEPEIVLTPIYQEAMSINVMNQINQYRIQNGLQALESTAYYQEKANTHAYEMVETRALWHSNNGECITNADDPFTAWINSPEHNAILLKANNTKGVVSIYFVDGYYYSVFLTAW